MFYLQGDVLLMLRWIGMAEWEMDMANTFNSNVATVVVNFEISMVMLSS